MELWERMMQIFREAIRENLPDAAVARAMEKIVKTPCAGKTVVVAVGKAGWEMARSAARALRGNFDAGFLITKYGHSRGPIEGFRIFEAGHPIPDQSGVDATEAVLRAVEGLSDADRVLLLLSGGGSALFEKPLIPLEELSELSGRLLGCGADIVEINTVRKRLSGVKGGRFARLCAPAAVYCVLLSDVLGDRPDMIASGPACPDASAARAPLELLEKYGIPASDAARSLLCREPVRELDNVRVFVTGGVGRLCESAKRACERMGYPALILTDSMACEAREAGRLLGAVARYQAGRGKKLALIAGGETVVHLKGKGLGGRNQELALAAAEEIAGLSNVALGSIGSDGTDGPTDAAGGYADGGTRDALLSAGIRIFDALEDNDAYHALDSCGGLIVTGATGTNVNDLTVILTEGE